MQPGSDEALRDLSRFDLDLLADVGVMVNLLNASGIGIYPELVHALGHEYGHGIETHDEIHQICDELTGWFLSQTDGRENKHARHTRSGRRCTCGQLHKITTSNRQAVGGVTNPNPTLPGVCRHSSRWLKMPTIARLLGASSSVRQ